MTLNPEQVEKVIESIEKIKRICNGTDGPAGLSDIDPFKTMEILARKALAILTPFESVETEEDNRRIRCNHCMSEFDEDHLAHLMDGETEACPVCGESVGLMDIERDSLAAAREQGAREAPDKAATFIDVEGWLISKSGTYKSEYIQAAIIMLRNMFEERAAIMGDSDKVEK